MEDHYDSSLVCRNASSNMCPHGTWDEVDPLCILFGRWLSTIFYILVPGCRGIGPAKVHVVRQRVHTEKWQKHAEISEWAVRVADPWSESFSPGHVIEASVDLGLNHVSISFHEYNIFVRLKAPNSEQSPTCHAFQCRLCQYRRSTASEV